MQLLAKDGIYLPRAPRVVLRGLLASGNRADLLINCPAGTFTFESSPTINGIGGIPPKINLDELNGGINGEFGAVQEVLMSITAVSKGAKQCELPVFEVNRPCCN